MISHNIIWKSLNHDTGLQKGSAVYEARDSALRYPAAADAENQLSETAGRLKEKILRHGRTFHAQGEDSVSIYFFPSEVIPLLKILALIFSVQMPAEKDNYPMIGRANRKENQFLHVQPQLEDLIA